MPAGSACLSRQERRGRRPEPMRCTGTARAASSAPMINTYAYTFDLISQQLAGQKDELDRSIGWPARVPNGKYAVNLRRPVATASPDRHGVLAGRRRVCVARRGIRTHAVGGRAPNARRAPKPHAHAPHCSETRSFSFQFPEGWIPGRGARMHTLKTRRPRSVACTPHAAACSSRVGSLLQFRSKLI